jgi:hypothetical protein
VPNVSDDGVAKVAETPTAPFPALWRIGGGVPSTEVIEPSLFELGVDEAIAFGSRVLLIVSAIQAFNSLGKTALLLSSALCMSMSVVTSVVGELVMFSDPDAYQG